MLTVTKDQVTKIQSHDNPILRDLMKFLGARQRYRTRTDIDRIYREQFAKVDYNEFLEAWKALDKSGVGSLVFGRKNNPNRFVWGVNLKDLGRAMLSTKAVTSQVVPIKRQETAVKSEPIKAAAPIEDSNFIVVQVKIPKGSLNTADLKALIELTKGLAK